LFLHSILQIGRHSDAIADYSTALSIEPNNAFAFYNRGISYDMQGMITQAMGDFRQASQLHPENIDFKHNLALCLRKMGDYNTAVDVYTQCLAMDPNHVKSLHGRGVCFEKLGDVDRAKKDFNALLSVHPDHVPCLLSVGQLLHAQKQPKDLQDATKILTKALTVSCPGGDYASLVTVLSSRESGTNKSGVSVSSVDVYRRAFDVVNALHCRSKVHIDLGNASVALRDLTACVMIVAQLKEKRVLSPSIPALYVFHNDMGACLKGNHEYDAAYQEFSTAIREIESELNARGNSGSDSSGSSGHQTVLINALVEAHNQRGFCLRKREKFQDAIRDYSKAIQLSPNVIRGYNNRAYCYAKCNLYEQAVDDYSSVIRLDPRNSHAFHNRGISLDKMGSFDKAIEDFAKVIELDSGGGGGGGGGELGPSTAGNSARNADMAMFPTRSGDDQSQGRPLTRRVSSFDSTDGTHTQPVQHVSRKVELDLRTAQHHQQQAAEGVATGHGSGMSASRHTAVRAHTPIRAQPMSNRAGVSSNSSSGNGSGVEPSVSVASGGGRGSASPTRPAPLSQRQPNAHPNQSYSQPHNQPHSQQSHLLRASTGSSGAASRGASGSIGIEEAARRLADFTPQRSSSSYTTAGTATTATTVETSNDTSNIGGSGGSGTKRWSSAGRIRPRSNDIPSHNSPQLASHYTTENMSVTASMDAGTIPNDSGGNGSGVHRRALLGTRDAPSANFASSTSSTIEGGGGGNVRSGGSLGYSNTMAMGDFSSSKSRGGTGIFSTSATSVSTSGYGIGHSSGGTGSGVGHSSENRGRPIAQSLQHTLRSNTPPPPPQYNAFTASPTTSGAGSASLARKHSSGNSGNSASSGVGGSGSGSKGVVMMSMRVKHNTSPGATATSSGTFQPSSHQHPSSSSSSSSSSGGDGGGSGSGGSVPTTRNSRPVSASLSGGLSGNGGSGGARR
jgi:tetratricopeptide (TPR) repeat protein